MTEQPNTPTNETLPDDLVQLDASLRTLALHDQQMPSDMAERIAQRTCPILAGNRATRFRSSHNPQPYQLVRWLMVGLPLAAAAGITLLVVNIHSTTRPSPNSSDSTIRLAQLETQLDAQLDTWEDLDALWQDDAFEIELTTLTLDAASLDASAAMDADSWLGDVPSDEEQDS